MSKSADADIERRESEGPAEPCDHICTGDCRREGCNCECGEWHEHRKELEEMYDQ